MRKDFVATGFLVRNEKVLLVKHRKLGLWLPVGGHIEAGETPEQALRREAIEEAGLELEILPGQCIKCPDKNVSMLLMPHHMQIELIKHSKEPTHEHIDLIYFCKAKQGKEKLNEKEALEIAWFSSKDLEKRAITENVRILGKKAIELAKKA